MLLLTGAYQVRLTKTDAGFIIPSTQGLANPFSAACWAGRTRISCSMKLVSQRDGEDLDPNWVTYKKDAPTGGGPSGPTGNDIGALDTGAAT